MMKFFVLFWMSITLTVHCAPILQNPDFEDSTRAPWTSTPITGTRGWSLGASTPQNGLRFAFAVDNAILEQSFSPVSGIAIATFQFWALKADLVPFFLQLSYESGTSSGPIPLMVSAVSKWQQFDILPYVLSTQRLQSISITKSTGATLLVDNFTTDAVPEPSAFALVFVAALSLLAHRRRPNPYVGCQRSN